MDTEEPDPKDVAAFEAWLTSLEQAPKQLHNEFQKLVDWAISEKERYLPDTKLMDDENKFYKIEMERLNNIFSLLRILNINVTDASLKADIWHLVVQTFIAGVNLGQYGEPIAPVKSEVFGRNARKMGAIKAERQAPDIAIRKNLLVIKGYDLEALAKSRKQCDAIVTEFAELCEAKKVRGVRGKRLQEYARELLKERRENSGTS